MINASSRTIMNLLAVLVVVCLSSINNIASVEGFSTITTGIVSVRSMMIARPAKNANINVNGNYANNNKFILHSYNGNNNNNNFDITKEQFDLYSLRNIRGDALIRYNTLNQSEPLRINLYLFAMLTLLSYPSISDAVFGEPATLPASVAAVGAATFSGYRFVRECKRRNRKLSRMEKELNAQELTLQIPNGPFADRPYGNNPKFELKQLRGKRRILAMYGSAAQLRTALIPFRTLRRRFAQASVLVVAVPNDGSNSNDWGIDDTEIKSVQYLAQAGNIDQWMDYFESLVGIAEEDDDPTTDNKNEDNKRGMKMKGDSITWFGLSNSGKSFGSGYGDSLKPIEILGQSLRPLECLDEDDKPFTGSSGIASSDDAAILSILAAQQQFYEALTTGNKVGIEQIFSSETSDELDKGDAYIEGWDKCLSEGARPSRMKTSGSDVFVVSPTEAYSTAIEFPEVDGITTGDATLLAVQKWIRTKSSSSSSNVDNDENNEWKLQLHQTIPWSPDTRAGATLRCDCRGCTALTRAPVSQYNFMGMVA